MNGIAPPRHRPDAPRQPGDHPLWLLPLAGLVAWQVWMTLGLLGARQTPADLLDDRPLVSGRHPLHLYHGYLGAATLWQRGVVSCYDPNFHAGYPKTPVFDSGSRPAELALALGGGGFRPGAYKVAVAVVCVAALLLLWLAGRGLGLSRAAALLACALGLVVWWGGPCREGLEAGEIDLLLAALLAAAQSGLLIRFHRAPGPLSLAGVAATGFLGWYAHPLFMAVLLPQFFVFYLGVGARHRLPWHVALFGGLLLAVLANLFWLLDWVQYWWIRVPLRLDTPLLAHRTFRTLWQAPLWGGTADRCVNAVLAAAALLGLALWNWRGNRATARLFGLAVLGLPALALAGVAGEPVARFGAARLAVPGLLFAVLPAAHALAAAVNRLCRAASATRLGLAGVALPALLALAAPGGWPWPDPFGTPAPLEIGLGGGREAVVARLREATSGEARILWEDRRGDRLTSRWTALLPVLTGRSFIGGLDADAGIEHTATGLLDGLLIGRPLGEWSDAELREYCAHYNVGWVVCWTAAARERFRAWPDAESLADLGEDDPGRLFAVRRRPSFALTGSARWVRADARRIVLEDVRPDKGQVVLSLHYQAGLCVTPSRVRLERAPGPRDPIPFVRLVTAEPVARVTITWDRP